jgi:hypothetical protein
MDITLRNGRTYYQVEPTLASILCELELAEKFERPAPIPTPAAWAVGIFPFSGRRHILVSLDGGRESYQFIGPPEKIGTFENSLPASAGKCPKSVLAKYRQTYQPYDPTNA